jgi:chromosome segregation ATPase
MVFNNNNTATDTKIAVLQERLSSYEVMMKKIDEAIQMMSKTSQNISKMLAVHEEKIDQCTKVDETIVKSIEDLRNENKIQHNEVEKRIYGLETNMGYGTKEHMDAIKKYGISKFHRKSFKCCGGSSLI